MKTIKRQEEIAFNAISFKDAVTLLSLMDALTNLVNVQRVFDLYNSLPAEEKEKYKKVWMHNDIHIQSETAERILKVLLDLGFVSQTDLKVATLDDLELK